MDYEKIGKLISELRKEKGLTQRELADKLMITDRAVSKWERGKNCPDISLLDDLSRELDISVIEILRGRRLESDERLENKDLIESMSFSEKNLKYRIKDTIIKVLQFIAMLLMIIVFYINLRPLIAVNIDYDVDLLDEYEISDIDEYKKYSDIVLNNQGTYSDEEYETIKNYVKKSNEVLNDDATKNYFYKSYINYEDIIELHTINFKYLSSTREDLFLVYEVLLSKDAGLVDEIIYNNQGRSIIYGDNYSFDYNEIDKKRYKDYILKLHYLYEKEIEMFKIIIEEGGINA